MRFFGSAMTFTSVIIDNLNMGCAAVSLLPPKVGSVARRGIKKNPAIETGYESGEQILFYNFFLRLQKPSPAKPNPTRARVVGSGTDADDSVVSTDIA